MLTEEEKKMVESFSQQINVRDTAMVLQYGAGAQKKMADFSDTALESVRTKDLGEVGGLLSDAVTELRSFDATEEKGLFGFFKKGANKIESLRARYDKAEANVDKIVKALQGHQMTLMKDAATLDKMYELNLTYFKELTMYILAGKKKLAEVREVELKELVDKAKATVALKTRKPRKTSTPCARASRRSFPTSTSRAPSPCKPHRRFVSCKTMKSRWSRKSKPPS